MKASIFSWIIVAIALIASIVTYPDLPEQLAIYWDMNNGINGLAHKAFTLLLFPAFMVILIVILPKKHASQDQKPNLHTVQNVVLISLLVLHGVTIASGYGLSIDITKVIVSMIGIIFTAAGLYMPHFQPNSYIGIKTVNTLGSEAVWKKTHRAASKFYVFGGLLMIASTFIPSPYQMFVFFGIVIIVVLASVFLSFHFGKDNK
ncbi:SdpI family protein [Bacillus sp. FJAT-28004]|uniref:SdpI family protein n=1 Tax=Bacillus sp. FJAT-28004 TaxID=1679165 RepID=UPI0006B56960|nr:SdpI family protein [Bacillus sp. FJAT-28004]